MPKYVEVNQRKYYNQFRNGENFDQNLNDFTRNLTGSVLEKVQVIYTIGVAWEHQYIQPAASFEYSINNVGNDYTVIGNSQTNFLDDGFAVGQLVSFRISGDTSIFADGTITALTTTTVEVNVPTLSSTPANLYQFILLGLEPLTALRYDFGLIENDDNYSNKSLVSQNDMGYYGSGIGIDTGGGVRSTSFVDLIVSGKYLDFVTGNAKARYVELKETVDNRSIPRFSQIFEIKHEYVINPWYLEGQLDDLINGIAPDFLKGDASLKQVINAEFREVLNDPNISYAVRDEDTLGSVAFLGESFNGFKSLYEVDSIIYQELNTLDSADGILIDGETKVTIQVSKIGGSIPNSGNIGVAISYLPQESDYTDTEDATLLENYIYDNAIVAIGGSSGIGNSYIKSISANSDGSVATIELIVEYSNDQKTYLSNRYKISLDRFLIAVHSGDSTLSNGNSDRVMITADVGTFDDSPDIPGLLTVTDLEIYPHDSDINVGQSFTNLIAWNEDGLVSQFNLNLDLNKSSFLNDLTFSIIAYNDITKEYFRLNEFNVDLSNQIEKGGVQVLNINTTRNYILRDGDQFNLLKVQTGALVAGIQTYNCIYAVKIPWQEWLKNLAVNTVFTDVSEPNDNLNYKTSNYSEKENYSIKLAIESNVFGISDLGVSGNTDYLTLTPTIIVNDYGEDGNVTPIYSGEIKTYRYSNNAPLGTSVLNGEDTLFTIEWTSSLGPITDINNIYAINRLEPANSTGSDIDELSSLRLPKESQRLLPLPNETKLKLSLSSGKVIAEGLIKGDRLIDGESYNLSGRIGGAGTVAPVGAFDYILDSLMN